VTETLDPVLKNAEKVTVSKPKLLGGLNSTGVKSHESIVMEHMTSNSKMEKENVVLLNHKLKVVAAMIVTETVTETPDPVPKSAEKVIVSKPKLLGGPSSTVARSHVSTVMVHMISSLKMEKENVELLNHKLKVVAAVAVAAVVMTVTETVVVLLVLLVFVKVTKSKLNVLAGLNITKVKLHVST